MHRRSWRRLCSKIKICWSLILEVEYRTNVEKTSHSSALYILCIELGRDTGVSLKHFFISRYYCNAFILELNLNLHAIRPFWSPGPQISIQSDILRNTEHLSSELRLEKACLKAIIYGGFWIILPCTTTLPSQSEVLVSLGTNGILFCWICVI